MIEIYHYDKGEDDINLFYVILPNKIGYIILFRNLENCDLFESFMITVAKSTNNRNIYDEIMGYLYLFGVCFKYNGVIINYNNIVTCDFNDGKWIFVNKEKYKNYENDRSEVLPV